jgi:RNA polymerase sigma factor (TIGR02999 family)
MELIEPREFSSLLREWSNGNRSALDRISGTVYRELRKLAASKLREERSGHTLQPTALVHEAYMRLVHHSQDQWHSRAHFFAVASQIMREILVDHARKRQAVKRGGGADNLSLDEAISFAKERGRALIALDDALNELATFDARKSKLIELKFFGGLETDEIAEALGVSVSTITRESRLAVAWLHNHMAGE